MENMYCDIIIAATKIITITKTERGVKCERDADDQVIDNAMKQCWLISDTYPTFTKEDPINNLMDLFEQEHAFLPDDSEVKIIKCEVVKAKCKKYRNSCFYLVSNCSNMTLSVKVRDSGIFCINVCDLKFIPYEKFSYELYFNVPDDAIEKNPEDSE